MATLNTSAFTDPPDTVREMFTINGKALSDAFKAANQAVLPKSPLPAFTHVRLVGRANTDSVRLIGSSGYLTVSAAAEAAVDDDVDLCLPADKLNAICSLGADSVTFKDEKGKVVARAGRTRMTLPTLPGDCLLYTSDAADDLLTV